MSNLEKFYLAFGGKDGVYRDPWKEVVDDPYIRPILMSRHSYLIWRYIIDKYLHIMAGNIIHMNVFGNYRLSDYVCDKCEILNSMRTIRFSPIGTILNRVFEIQRKENS